MNFEAPFLHPTRITGTRPKSRGALALVLILLFSLEAPAQQTSVNKTSGPSTSKTQPQFQEVEKLLSQGLIEQAKAKIQDVLERDPSSVEGYNLLGIIYTDQKDFTNSLEAFQHALKLDPSSTRTRNNLGNVYIAQGKPDLAEKEFRTVVRVDPANRDANYNLGLVLLAKGHPAEAIGHFQRVRPANVETRFNLIRAFLQAHRISEGLKAATELSAENKEDVQLHFTLGVLLASEKQYRPAQLELEKANALRPETFEILFNLGQAYLRGLDYPKAEQALNRALRLKPDSPETLYLLGQVCADQTRAVDALDLLMRAHKLAPENTAISGGSKKPGNTFRKVSSSIHTMLPACLTWAISRSIREITPKPKSCCSRRCVRIRISPTRCWSWRICASKTRNWKRPPSFSEDT